MPPRQRMLRRFEYRVVWKHKGKKYQHALLCQRSDKALRAILRVATDEPWRGMTVAQMRKSWLRYMLLSDLDWAAVESMSLQEVSRKLRDAYGKIEFIRVEWRQVGEWTEYMNPMEELLRSPYSRATMLKRDQAVAAVDAMDKDSLNAWRMLPRTPATGAQVRKRVQS